MTESTRTCDRCTAPVPEGASTCPNCGAPLTEAAAVSFETRKLDGDVFATTKLEDAFATTKLEAPVESLHTTIVDEPEAAAPASKPKPVRQEPIFTTPPPAEQSFEMPVEQGNAQETKQWYQKPVAWAVTCGVLLVCCVCTSVIAALIVIF